MSARKCTYLAVPKVPHTLVVLFARRVPASLVIKPCTCDLRKQCAIGLVSDPLRLLLSSFFCLHTHTLAHTKCTVLHNAPQRALFSLPTHPLCRRAVPKHTRVCPSPEPDSLSSHGRSAPPTSARCLLWRSRAIHLRACFKLAVCRCPCMFRCSSRCNWTAG